MEHQETLGVMDVFITLIVFVAEVNGFWSVFFIYLQFNVYKIYINKAIIMNNSVPDFKNGLFIVHSINYDKTQDTLEPKIKRIDILHESNLKYY